MLYAAEAGSVKSELDVHVRCSIVRTWTRGIDNNGNVGTRKQALVPSSNISRNDDKQLELSFTYRKGAFYFWAGTFTRRPDVRTRPRGHKYLPQSSHTPVFFV